MKTQVQRNDSPCSGSLFIQGVRAAPIPGALPIYLILEDGRVWSNGIRPGFLKTGTPKNGYATVALWMLNGKRYRRRIHSIVANAFIPKPESDRRLEVDHKDSDPSNCHVNNLEWVTHSENIRRMFSRGRGNLNPQRGESNIQHKLTTDQVREIRSSPESSRVIGRRMGVGHTVVVNIRNRRKWPHID